MQRRAFGEGLAPNSLAVPRCMNLVWETYPTRCDRSLSLGYSWRVCAAHERGTGRMLLRARKNLSLALAFVVLLPCVAAAQTSSAYSLDDVLDFVSGGLSSTSILNR